MLWPFTYPPRHPWRNATYRRQKQRTWYKTRLTTYNHNEGQLFAAISTLELVIANLPWRTTTRTEQLPMPIFAHALPGLYSYVLNISIIYSMVSTPRRNILSTPVGGTQPLITFWLIQLHYRYTKRHRKHTLYPTTIYLLPTYLSMHPLPSHHLPIPYHHIPHQPPHHHAVILSPPNRHQRPKLDL
jgi:hypothetical protein